MYELFWGALADFLKIESGLIVSIVHLSGDDKHNVLPLVTHALKVIDFS